MPDEEGVKILGGAVPVELEEAVTRSINTLPYINGKKVTKRHWAKAIGEWWLGLPEKDRLALLSGGMELSLTDYFDARCRQIVQDEFNRLAAEFASGVNTGDQIKTEPDVSEAPRKSAG